MVTFIYRRLIQSVIVIFLVTIILFLMMRLLPGDPILMIVTSSELSGYSEENIALLKHKYGLDQPVLLQYFHWIGDLSHGNLGISILDNVPVKNEVFRRIPISLYLGILSMIISAVLGISAGILCAVRWGSWIDTIVTVASNLGITVPNFWLGLLLIYFFGLYLKWLPVMGFTSPFSNFWLSVKQTIMPVICLATFSIAGMSRQTRSCMLDVMHQDYVRTAWAKGLTEKTIIVKHALRNGLIPIVTLLSVHLAVIIGGSVFIETVFNIPGIGRLLVSSVLNQDYPYVQGIVLIIAISVVLANIATDITYGVIDPRVRYK